MNMNLNAFMVPKPLDDFGEQQSIEIHIILPILSTCLDYCHMCLAVTETPGPSTYLQWRCTT
jgi:hypothetical protein